jgi:hypothetical protein
MDLQREKGGRTKEKQKGGSSSLRSAKEQTRRLCCYSWLFATTIGAEAKKIEGK